MVDFIVFFCSSDIYLTLLWIDSVEAILVGCDSVRRGSHYTAVRLADHLDKVYEVNSKRD